MSAAKGRVLIAMAGLPGTGKTTIAGELAQRLDALVLNKDLIRANVFPAEAIDFSRGQDEVCMDVMFVVAAYVLKAKSSQIIILDGRTFTRSYQVSNLLSQAHALNAKPVIIECVCDDEVARQRIDHDLHTGSHPAGNRTCRLYKELKEKVEPIAIRHLVIDTGRESLENCLGSCLAYLTIA